MTPSRIDTPHRQPIAQIGRGGMAEVFLAASKAAGVCKLVVLKRIWPDLAANPDFLAMFLDEARLSARMSHPNIVQVYDVCGDPQRPTITMEYLHGQSLAALVKRVGGPAAMPLPVRLRIVMDVLSGLDYAHRLADYDGTPLGVVHRDVSPQNVLISYDGHVKVVDFGIAKSLAVSSGGRAGYVAGKPAYMAPDALHGASVDHRADVFSVGVILWELLEGRRLWAGGDEATILRRLRAGLTIPDLRVDPDEGVSDELRAVCRRALAIDPAERFDTAAAMQTALERASLDVEALGGSATRQLAELMARMFAGERSARERLIERRMRNDDERNATSWPPVKQLPDEGDALELEDADLLPVLEDTRVRLVGAPSAAATPPRESFVRATMGGWRWLAPACVGALTIAIVFALSWRQDRPTAVAATVVSPAKPILVQVPSRPSWTRSAEVITPRPLAPPSQPAAVPEPSHAATRGDLGATGEIVNAEPRTRRRRSAARRRREEQKALFALSDVATTERAERAGTSPAAGYEIGPAALPVRRRAIDTTDPFLP